MFGNFVYGILCGLLSAWFLKLFGFCAFCIEVLQPFYDFPLTKAHYYFVFAILGGLLGLLHK